MNLVKEHKGVHIPTDANGVIGYDTSIQPIIPVRDKLVVKKNAHPNCDGTEWGWIEGCSLNICWSDGNSRFNREKAEELVRQYNAQNFNI